MNKPTYVRGPLRRAVLAYLRANPGSTPDAIGAALGDLLKRDDKDKAKGASQLCQRLYDAGFLFRQKAPNTHGQYAYMLTPKAMGEAPPDIKVADDRVSLPAAEPAAQAQCADADDNVLTEEDTEADLLRYQNERLREALQKKDETIEALREELDRGTFQNERRIAALAAEDAKRRYAQLDRAYSAEKARHAELRRRISRLLGVLTVEQLAEIGIKVSIDLADEKEA